MRKFPYESSTDRLLREELRRQRQMDEIRRPFLNENLLRTARENSLAAQQIMRFLGSDTIHSLRDTAERNFRLAQELKEYVTPASVLARQQIAHDVFVSLKEYDRRAREIALSLAPSFAAATAAMEANAHTLSSLFASEAWHDQFTSLSRLAAELRPSMAAIAASSNMLRTVDAATLRASLDYASELSSRLQFVAEQTDLADAALANLAATEDPEEAVSYLTQFVNVVAAMFRRLGENTIREIAELGLIGWLLIAAAILDAVPDTESIEVPPAERAHFEEVDRKLSALREQLSELEKVVGEASDQFVADLPRAEVNRRANVRTHPNRSGALLIRLERGSFVAIAERQGKWRKVIYRDPLTYQLCRGWVYQSSLAELTSKR